MGILERIAKLVRANLNDLIESATNSERALEKHVEEMEEDLADARTVLAATRRQGAQVSGRLRRRETEAQSWETRAEAALRDGSEELAREAVRRKLDAERRAADLREEHEQIESRLRELEEAIAPLEERLSEAHAQLHRLIRARETAERDREFERISATLRADQGEEAGRFEEEVERAKFEAEAIRELAEGSVEARFRALEQPRDAVESELARIRKNIGRETGKGAKKPGDRKA